MRGCIPVAAMWLCLLPAAGAMTQDATLLHRVTEGELVRRIQQEARAYRVKPGETLVMKGYGHGPSDWFVIVKSAASYELRLFWMDMSQSVTEKIVRRDGDFYLPADNATPFIKFVGGRAYRWSDMGELGEITVISP